MVACHLVAGAVDRSKRVLYGTSGTPVPRPPPQERFEAESEPLPEGRMFWNENSALEPVGMHFVYQVWVETNTRDFRHDAVDSTLRTERR